MWKCTIFCLFFLWCVNDSKSQTGTFRRNQTEEPEWKQVEGQGVVAKCHGGFRLRNNKICEDIDECAEGSAVCGPTQICSNTVSGYDCICRPGLKLVGYHLCEDVDECASADHESKCSQNAECVNTIGSYQCKCREGFMADPDDDKVCIDVDECSETRRESLCQHHCNNTIGNYQCYCDMGYQLKEDNSTCSDIDECKVKPCPVLCINNPGSYRCTTCPRGYKPNEGKKNCIESFDMAQTIQLCCNTGTEYAADHKQEKCSLAPVPPGVPISVRAICSIAKTQCCEAYLIKEACNNGIDLATSTNSCDPVQGTGKMCCDSCKKGRTAGQNRDLEACRLKSEGNSPEELLASYAYKKCCEKSANRDRSNSSVSTKLASDKCVEGTHLCDQYQNCINTNGSYKCHCKLGFKMDTITGICVDINECELPHPPCPTYLCENTIGAYKCGGMSGNPRNLAPSNAHPPTEDNCPFGFKLGANYECEDMDECADQKDDCNHLSQFCINTYSSFYCQDKLSKHCPPGFNINPESNKCEDIDECEDNSDNCRTDQVCVNQMGQYNCKLKVDINSQRLNQACRDGMRIKYGKTYCEDIHECKDNSACRTDQVCVNQMGQYQCKLKIDINSQRSNQACPDGMRIKYGKTYCEDIDECVEGTHLCDQNQHCLNTNGSYECHCKRGFEFDTDGACVDVNECASGHHDCYSETQRCDNTVGSYLCIRVVSCGSGYILHHSTGECQDIDECALGRHNCARAGPDYQCINIPGYFRCVRNRTTTTSTTPAPLGEKTAESNKTVPGAKSVEKAPISTTVSSVNCPYGYEIDERGGCLDIDECGTNRHSCSDLTELCTNTIGGYFCFCAPSFRRDFFTGACDLITSSSTTTSTTTSTTPATTTSTTSTTTPTTVSSTTDKSLPYGYPNNRNFTGAFYPWIYCDFGYHRNTDTGECEDIDECTTNRHSCSDLTELCTNTIGGYFCICAPSFRRDPFTGACDLITSSSTTTSTTTSTTPATTTSTTSTTTPTTVSSTTDKSLPYGNPNNRNFTGAFYPWFYCEFGYHRNTDTGECEDVDECTNGESNCASVEICTNTPGGYRCDCPPNWALDNDEHKCYPMKSDEHFPHGYDIDECESGQSKCGQLKVCTNLPGGYVCSCPTGYKLVDDNDCADIDECSLADSKHMCSATADCVNTIGSYECRCHDGFKPFIPSHGMVCIDIDECTESRPGSLCPQRCNNVWGGYRCSCHRGYRLNFDNRTCSDIDECEEFMSKVCVGRCLNEPGSYRCSCPSGYRLTEDKRSCIDIDECETGEATCASGATGDTRDVCLNTRGGYRCNRIACPPGYHLNSTNRCNRIDRNCRPGDWDCAHRPMTISFNYITFVSNLYIPDSKLKLFTMRGPSWQNTKFMYELNLTNTDAPPGVKKASPHDFILTQVNNEAVVSLLRPLEGPQSIELQLVMELFSEGLFVGIAVAKIFIFVSEYEF